MLSTERQIGSMGGAGHIPWSKAMLFARSAGLGSPDEQDRFWRMIRAMDGAYLKWLADQQKVDPQKKA